MTTSAEILKLFKTERRLAFVAGVFVGAGIACHVMNHRLPAAICYLIAAVIAFARLRYLKTAVRR